MNAESFLRRKYILTDVLSTSIVYIGYNGIRNELEHGVGLLSWDYLLSIKSIAVYLAFVGFWIGFFALSGYYNKPKNKSRLVEFSSSIISIFLGSVITFLLWVVDDILHNTSLYLPLFLYLTGMMLAIVYPPRLILTTLLIRKDRREGVKSKVLLITDREAFDRSRAILQQMGKEIIEEMCMDLGNTAEERERELDRQIEDISYAISVHNPESLVVSLEGTRPELISLLLYKLYPFKLPIKVPIQSLFFAGAKVKVTAMTGEPMVDMTETNMAEWEKNVKWLFDKVFSLLLLALTSPLLLYLSIRVKLSSEGPVIFCQERIGLHGKPFMIYKFRSMYQGAEMDGPKLSSDNDHRITKLGKRLRKYRLDELPQFWNVLKGDMSFVGPRPERAHYIRLLIQRAPYYYLLHNVRPGITSWGMVRYGYASNLEEMHERLKYDWLYYENMSLQLDLAVLVYTLKTLIKGSGK
ncbi:hypothetical protein HQ45_00365 [Porphyromonas crevioricanis]|uniref:exopolysaccharide biosynthesis polyprenyl glycosylphosphotransferase n=1 Tax=Porphyromonas crevioricanis TaxID=393921 RepID=UPI00052C213B|nr:exopolysaccharide biosynthesis polyprenyl glycosylphosphotransferase [Porphyromonas crevioricanis]KGN91272.1 hypothetical protein HQ45_00365 [Porphyromonas crevioricanis]